MATFVRVKRIRPTHPASPSFLLIELTQRKTGGPTTIEISELEGRILGSLLSYLQTGPHIEEIAGGGEDKP